MSFNVFAILKMFFSIEGQIPSTGYDCCVWTLQTLRPGWVRVNQLVEYQLTGPSGATTWWLRVGVTELPWYAQTPSDCCVGTGSHSLRDGENMEWIQIGATASQVATEAEAASMGAEAFLVQTHRAEMHSVSHRLPYRTSLVTSVRGSLKDKNLSISSSPSIRHPYGCSSE